MCKVSIRHSIQALLSLAMIGLSSGRVQADIASSSPITQQVVDPPTIIIVPAVLTATGEPQTLVVPAPVEGQPVPASVQKVVVQKLVKDQEPETKKESPTQTTKVQRHDSKYGGCRGNFCLAPAFAMQAVLYDRVTGELLFGTSISGGYGMVWHTIVDLGLSGHGGIQFSSTKVTPTKAEVLFMISVANYLAFGAGFNMTTVDKARADFHLIVCVAASWIPGLSSKTF